MKKLLKLAMAWTLAASMIVATPLTASATGISGLYNVQDGSGNVVGGDDDEPTGTVTSTYTGTGTGTGAIKDWYDDNSAQVVGISINQEDVQLEIDGTDVTKKTLTAEVLYDGEVKDEIKEQINHLIEWRTSDLTAVSIKASADDRTTVELTPRRGTKADENVTVTASVGGKYGFAYTYTDQDGKVKLGKLAASENSFEDAVNVSVKEYSTALEFSIPTDKKFYLKHTEDFNKYLKRTPETANDTITWTTSDKKVATVSAAGVVTIKKADQTVTITAISEKGKKATTEIKTEEGVPATKVTVYKSSDASQSPYKKDTYDLGTGKNLNGEACRFDEDEGQSVKVKLDTRDGKDSTDEVEWSSKKSAIAEVAAAADGMSATITPKTVGKTTITATASSGKKASVAITVKATLQGLKIETDSNSLYTGQSVTLTAKRDPEQSKDAIKWAVYDDERLNTKSKAASINSKGVLTIKPLKPDNVDKVYVVVQSSKQLEKKTGGKDYVKSDRLEISITQSSIEKITVKNGSDEKAAVVAEAGYESGRKVRTITTKTEKIAVPKGKTYPVAVVATTEGQDQTMAKTLAWSSKSTKVATVTMDDDGNAVITAVGKGKTTITASGVRVTTNSRGVKKAATIKATYTVNVTQPTTSLKLDKTAVTLKTGANAGYTKDLKATIKVKSVNKNADKGVYWSVKKYNPDTKAYESVSGNSISVTNGRNGKTSTSTTFKASKNNYKSGDQFRVTAKAPSGVTASAIITIVEPTKKLTLKEVGTSGNTEFTRNKTELDITTKDGKSSLTLYPEILLNNSQTKKAGEKYEAEGSDPLQTAGVTYSVSKKGIVSIVGDTVYAVAPGKTVITAKTDDGKSYKLTVTVK